MAMSLRRYRLLSLAPVLLALSAGALAQEAATSPLTQGGAILLPTVDVQGQRETATGPVQGFVAGRAASATKTDTPLIETPQAITVITRDRIDAQAVRSVEEALRYAPGVTAGLSGFDPRFDSARIRGFDARPSQYLNGLRLLRQFGPTSIEQYGLERIEIVRGPSSVLYGQTVPGGLINLVSKRPTETPFGEVNLSAGNNDRFQGAFDLGGPLDEAGQFSYRATGLVRNSDTDVDHVGDDRYFFAPALTWRPDGETRVTLLGSYQYDQGGSPIGLPAQGTLLYNPNGKIPRSRYAGEEDFSRSDVTTTTLGWDIEKRLNSVFTLRQNTRYTHNTVKYDTMYANGFQPDLRTLNRGTLVQRERSDTINLDTGLQADFSTGPVVHKVLAGVDVRQYWGRYETYFGTGPSVDIFNPARGLAVPDSRRAPFYALNRNDDLHQLGLYLQDQMRWNNWILLLGGRQDWAGSEQTSRLNGDRVTQNDNAFTGRAALMYAAPNGLSPYVSYSTSFDPIAGSTAGGEAFRPTEGRQYEIGLKYQPPGMNSFLTASAFDLTQTNVTTRDPVVPAAQVQTGEINVRGLELEAVASLAEGFSLIASYTYMDAEITSDNGGSQGNRPALVPEHMANLWGQYRFQEGSRLAGFGLGGGVRYMGNFYGDNANTFRTPSVTLLDASVSYEWDRYKLSVNASNLADKEYVSSCTGANYCYYGPGRTVIANLAYRW